MTRFNNANVYMLVVSPTLDEFFHTPQRHSFFVKYT